MDWSDTDDGIVVYWRSKGASWACIADILAAKTRSRVRNHRTVSSRYAKLVDHERDGGRDPFQDPRTSHWNEGAVTAFLQHVVPNDRDLVCGIGDQELAVLQRVC